MFREVTLIGFLLVASTFALPRYEEISPRIVNGSDASILEIPHIISLRYFGSHSCGGTVLNPWWVLTAAHCVDTDTSPYTVQYGSTVISRTGSNVIDVEKFIPHEDYNDFTLENDIALVKLKTPIDSDALNLRVRLAMPQTFYPTGTAAVLAGWGLNATGGSIQTTLQKADLQIYAPADCNDLHGGGVHFTNICGGIPGGGRGQCSGDSGGPLFVNGIQVGIVSWSRKPCTIAPYPGVFTAVSHYVGWISANSGINFGLNMFLMSEQ
jgi:secreted trypsin-like serine protease